MAWSSWFDLTSNEVANEAPTSCGVYCLARKNDPMAYSAAPSLTVFIGVAGDRQRGLRAVLGDIAAASSGQLQLERREHGGLRFCFQGNLGDKAPSLYSELLAGFVKRHGELPRCNRAES